VSQTLFSANLIAEALPRQWRRNPEKALEQIEQLHELTRGAHAEMRALLLELRPAVLLEADLKTLLPQLAEAVRSRKRLTISVHVDEPNDLPPAVKLSLYRITQEALNNVAKHSRATQAAIRLHVEDNGQVELSISDNGQGFEPGSVSANSLGLGIMRERANAIGATLDISTEKGKGTQITVTWEDTSKTSQVRL
jgi:signal transduction histidine kinase